MTMKKRATSLINSLSDKLGQNKELIMNKLGNSTDIIVREFKIDTNLGKSAAIFYTDGLTDTVAVQKLVMESLLFEFENVKKNNQEHRASLLEQLKSLVLTVGELKEISDLDKLLVSLMSGYVI